MTLPDLETICHVCNGDKGRHTGEEESGWAECWYCEGSGFVPTPLGSRILELVRHNSKVEISGQLRVYSHASSSQR